ncbi:hypothetical protein [Plantactinospora sonchi]|uniref:DUF4352 domain-containing protein n=1 Tax=Plantactinospora sonchi TaxID=1544735 RepID=A0ABU7RWI0_9ACTN
MPASTPLRTAGAVLAGCLLAAAPGTPALADTPPITVGMTSSGTGAPRYEIQVRNGTDGTVKTTVRQDLPPGAVPASVSQGGQAGPGRTGTEVVWQVQLGARAVATLSTTLATPPTGAAASAPAPACAFVANGNLPYDCASTTWHAGGAAGGAGGGGVAAEPADAGPWWGGATAWGGGLGLLVLLSVAAAVFWGRRLRRRRVAAEVNRDVPEDTGGGRAAARERRIVRRVGRPIARATARVRGDAKIPAPAEVLAATGHRSGSDLGSADPPPTGDRSSANSPDQDHPLRGQDARQGHDVAADRETGAGEEGGLVGIAGGARYVGRAEIPPRTPVPGFEDTAVDEPDEAVPDGPQLDEEPDEVPARVVARAPRPRTSPPIKGVRRSRPPAWTAVGIAALAAIALATVTAWTGSSQVSAISGDRQPSSGAWVGQTVAGPLGTSLRESAFEFTVYRLNCPSGPTGCQAVVGVRNVTDKSQPWHGQLQRAYLPDGDWVGADVPATRIANAGRDPFAEPLPAGERLIVPLVFASTGATPPDRIELRSAVFSAGVSVDVPR